MARAKIRSRRAEGKIIRAEGRLDMGIIAQAAEAKELLENDPPKLGPAMVLLNRMGYEGRVKVARELQQIVRRKKAREKIPVIFRDELRISEVMSMESSEALKDVRKFKSTGKRKFLKKAIQFLSKIEALGARELAEERVSKREVA